MSAYEYLGADSEHIYILLKRGEKQVKLTLPNVGDYFDGEGNSAYIETHYANLWNTGITEAITVTTDKVQILADGVDVATVTAMIPVMADHCYVTVNGPPAERAEIVNDQVVREFSSETVGVFRVDFYAGDKSATIFIEAVE